MGRSVNACAELILYALFPNLAFRPADLTSTSVHRISGQVVRSLAATTGQEQATLRLTEPSATRAG